MIKNLLKDKKKLTLIIGGLLILIVIIVVLNLLFKDGGLVVEVKNPDGEKFENEYEQLNGELGEEGKILPEVNISSNNVIKYSVVDDIINIFSNDGDGVVYFGSANCAYCRNVVQILYDTAVNTKLDTIYYVDLSKEDDYTKLFEYMGEKFLVDNKEIYSPLVIFITNGDISSYNKGTLFSQGDPYVEMDDSQKAGLSEIYGYGIRDVVNSINSKNSAKKNEVNG